MSHNYQAKVIYGFPLAKYPSEEFLGKDAKGYQVYLDEWLAGQGCRPVQQINGGLENGGTPDYLVGVEVASVEDFTRATSYTRLDAALNVSREERVSGKVIRAARLLGAKAEDIGFYLLGVRG